MVRAWHAGQAVVQMARHKHSSEEFAIKFFAKRADFDSESALYREQGSALFSFLPKVWHHEQSFCVLGVVSKPTYKQMCLQSCVKNTVNCQVKLYGT